MINFSHRYGNDLTESEINKLKDLWIELFNDSRQYLDMFFEVFINNVEIVMGTENDNIIAIAYLVPLSLSTGDKCYYLYAGGVNPNNRGQHVFANMQDFILDYLKGYPILGYSVEPYLVNWYKTFLFPVLYTATESILIKDNSTSATTCLSVTKHSGNIDEIISMHCAFVKSIDSEYIEYPDWFYNLLKVEKNYCGDVFDVISINEDNYYIIGRIDDNTLLIEETNIDKQLMSDICINICDLYQVNSINLKLPPLESSNDESHNVYSGQGTITGNLWAPFMLL